jgi:hypothetical protein
MEAWLTVDYDRNQFLEDVYETLLAVPGDPVRHIDFAIEGVITAHVQGLRRLAQRHRLEIIDMVEEHRKTGQPVATKWRA